MVAYLIDYRLYTKMIYEEAKFDMKWVPKITIYWYVGMDK